jgi:hypothetical protein
MPQRLRIFVSSPADVPEERLRADLIGDKLSQDYSRFFTIESYRWEHEAMLASRHFQDAIEPPSAFDIVVLVVWSRLGTPLPEKTATREYHGIDGRVPVTGTEWEYEEALKVAREKGAPNILAFRNVSPAPVDTLNSEARAQSNAQLDALDQFWRRHFADRGVFLAAYDEYHTLEEFAQRLEESLRKLIERRIKALAAGVSRDEPIWLGEPFRGLESYEFEHAPIFFGRNAAVTKATEHLAANARSGCAFLLVSGASGSGKSSLIKAGVVPRLMKPQRISGAAFLRRCVFRPAAQGSDVFLGLARVLTGAAAEDVGLPELIALGQDAAQLATHLRGAAGEPGFPFVSALGRLTEAERKSGRLLAFEEAKLILVVDQFEELFTVSGITPEDRRLFVQLVAGLARSGAVWVIAILRADFWHRAAEIPEVITLTEGHGRIDLAAATAAELAEMIRKPAQAAGLSFEMHPQTGLGLDVVLAEDAAAEPGALPLLSFTLDELYKHAKALGETVLTHASYEALGGLDGAIANRAEEVVAGLPASARAALPRVLRALTTVSGAVDAVPVARSAHLASFTDGTPARLLVDAFVAARLLVAGGKSGAVSTIQLAHEALIGRWKRAREQLAADRRDLETRALVEQQLARWSPAHGYARLLRNPDLANAADLAKRWGDELDAPTRDFIKRSARLRKVFTGSLAAGLAIALCLAGIAYWQRGIAVQQRGIAQTQTADADSQKKIATQKAALLSANLADNLLSQGKVDESLVLLIESAKAFDDKTAPDKFLIALQHAISEARDQQSTYFSAKARIFSSEKHLYLFDHENHSLFRIDSTGELKFVGPYDNDVISIRVRHDNNSLIVLRADYNVDIITISDSRVQSLGPLIDPDEQKTIGKVATLIYPDGIVIARPAGDDFDATKTIYLMDVDAKSTIKATMPNADAVRYITTYYGQRLFATANNGFVYAADQSFARIARSEMFDNAWSPIYFCKNIGPKLDDATKKYVESNFKWVGYYGDHCINADNSFVFVIHDNHYSAGTEYEYKLANTKADKTIEITPLLLKLLGNQDPEAPAGNAELGTIDMISEDGIFAASYNREVFVFNQDHILLRTKISNAPSITKLLSKDVLAVLQKTSRGQKLTLFKFNRARRSGFIKLSDLEKDKLVPLNNGSCVGYMGVFPKEAILPNRSKIVFDTRTPTSSEGGAVIKILNRDGDFRLIDLSAIDPDCVQVNVDFSYLLIKKDSRVEIYDLKAVLKNGSLNGVEKKSLEDSDLSGSAFFIGATDQIVTSHWNNRVLRWHRTRDGYVGEEIFTGDHPIKYAEPSRDGKRLLLVEDWGAGDTRGLLYSVTAQNKWMDIVSNYKLIGLAFTAEEGIVFGESAWREENSNFMTIKTLSQMLSDAKALVSRSCLSTSSEDYTNSICWPDLSTE